MLTISKMHGQSVAYYESTVDSSAGVDNYYSEDGSAPAQAWVRGSGTVDYGALLGVEQGQLLDGRQVTNWFNKVIAPSGEKLGRALRDDGVPGFDLTFCAPKSVSVLWGLSGHEDARQAVDDAHATAVATALDYLESHAAYTRMWDENKTLVVERTLGLSGVKYEHRTSRAGDPHVHSHVLLANRQLCADGQARSLDGVSVYHEARAAGMLYQAVLREELSRNLGVVWGEVSNGQADILGLHDADLLAAFSTRSTEIGQWETDNGLSDNYAVQRVAQKTTRQTKDVDVALDELEARWNQVDAVGEVARFVASLGPYQADKAARPLPTPEAVLAEVIEERSTFTRADVVEKCAEMIPAGALSTQEIVPFTEVIATAALESIAMSVTPDRARELDRSQREGSQRFTTDSVIAEVSKGIDLATTRTNNAVSAEVIKPVEGKLSPAQAEAMATVVSSEMLASVVVAPAGAGKTSSLKAARQAWESAGKTVVGLAPTGKAADVMVGEHVAHDSSTIARALYGTQDLAPAQVAARLGWNKDTVVVVDEAGMVSTPDVVRLLEIAQAAQARMVLVGDPHQYSAVKARSGMLATLAYELPDAVELSEVFRQRDVEERAASTQLRSGDHDSVKRAAQWYAEHDRLHAGSATAMLDDALAGWKADVEAGKESLLVAATGEQVAALNAGAQKIRADRGELDLSEARALSTGQWLHSGDVLLTRKNDYDLLTSVGDVVRNGQRWRVDELHGDGSISATRLDDTQATAVIPAAYLRESGQLGYASTGHAAQGATVDVARVVAGVGQIDRAAVYVPLTRGREGNFLYLAESMPGDSDTGHGGVAPTQRRDTAEYARDLLVAAASRDNADQTPHQVWGKARADWALTRFAASQELVNSPFIGTRMGAVMEERAARRAERFREFYIPTTRSRDTQHAAVATPESEQRQPVVLTHDEQAEQAQHRIEGYTAGLAQVRAEYVQAQNIVQAMGQEKQRLESAIKAVEWDKRQAVLESQGRGFFTKIMKRSEDECRLNQLESALTSVRGELDRFMPGYREAEAAMEDLGARVQVIVERKKQAEAEVGFHRGQALVEQYGSGMDLSDALSKQSKARRVSSPQQWQAPQYNHDRDHGMER